VNGAESLVGTLVAGGVTTCFTNPGTSEMHLVAALDRRPDVRCILGLFEGVVTGAADGYARMTGTPACTLLHLGPGLANGLANLHNAVRARTPIVNIVGQHPAAHLPHDAPLTADIEAIARPYASWVRTSRAVRALGADTADAIAAARTAPGEVVTLIVPADVAWSDGGTVVVPPPPAAPPMPADAAVDRAVALLRGDVRTAILIGGAGLLGQGLTAAARVADATGATLLAPYNFARIVRGGDTVAVERLPYLPEQAESLLRPFRHLILVGAPLPAAYFAYPGRRAVLTAPETVVHVLARPTDDVVGALEALAGAVGRGPTAGATPAGSPHQERSTAAPATSLAGALSLPGIAAAIAAVLPAGAIVVDESMTSGRGIMAATSHCPPHDYLVNTGGSIGIAMPLAVGAAVAAPDRPVLCLSADGSGMYTAQALWTMARYGLRVTTVVFANRSYGILRREFLGLGVGDPGPVASSLFDIGRPDLDWVMLGAAMGVPGRRVPSLEALVAALRAGLGGDGPSLIELLL
jgi:acetolactate synthase-1/2/3 large subunit